jgi:regulation of enolase protein 1 (concanavalin A-like superfamily)
LAASSFSWTIQFGHDAHLHPHSDSSGSKTGSFTANYSESADNVYYRLSLTVVDTANNQHTSSVDLLPRKSTNTITTVPSGLKIKLGTISDNVSASQELTTPASFVGVEGYPRALEAISPQTLAGKNYQFTSWSNGGPRVQTVNTPATNTTYTATFSEIPSTLPSPWVTQDIGTVGVVGSANHSSGTFTVAGSGADIWNIVDAFRFVYQDLTGDGVITARINSQTNTDPWAKAGVMIREDLAAGSKHAFMLATPTSGLAFQYRTATNGGSFGVETTGNVPIWVRIQRVGSTITGFRSMDGTTWTSMGSTTITMVPTVKLGLAVTSHNNSVLSSAAFANVTVSNNTPIPGDANGDGKVNISDLTIVINTWGSTTDLRADFSRDNIINLADITIIINNWRP